MRNHDRTAEDRTVLVAPPDRLLGIEEAARVEHVVAEEVPGRAAERVGAALGDGADDARRRAAELRRHQLVLDLELLDDVDRRADRSRVLELVGVFAPVEKVADRLRGRSVERGGAGGRAEPSAARIQ